MCMVCTFCKFACVWNGNFNGYLFWHLTNSCKLRPWHCYCWCNLYVTLFLFFYCSQRPIEAAEKIVDGQEKLLLLLLVYVNRKKQSKCISYIWSKNGMVATGNFLSNVCLSRPLTFDSDRGTKPANACTVTDNSGCPGLCSDERGDLFIPQTRTPRLRRQSFLIAAPVVWNLP